jgi:serine/threonine protein kinase
MAPEIVESCFDNRNYDLKVDIWSLGVLTYQLMIDEELESVCVNNYPRTRIFRIYQFLNNEYFIMGRNVEISFVVSGWSFQFLIEKT